MQDSLVSATRVLADALKDALNQHRPPPPIDLQKLIATKAIERALNHQVKIRPDATAYSTRLIYPSAFVKIGAKWFAHFPDFSEYVVAMHMKGQKKWQVVVEKLSAIGTLCRTGPFPEVIRKTDLAYMTNLGCQRRVNYLFLPGMPYVTRLWRGWRHYDLVDVDLFQKYLAQNCTWGHR